MPILDDRSPAIHYEAAGHGPRTLVLVHGSGGSSTVWTHQLQGLADVARVIALDLPGHGKSGGTATTVIDESAAVVRRAVDALGLAAVVVGGHSMGGGVAQAFALAHRERCAGLALIGTGARLRVLPKIFELLEQDYAEGARFVTELALASSAPAELKRTVYELALAVPAATMANDFRACDAFDVRAELATITAPTVVICGAEDQLTPVRYAEYVRDHIAGARLVVVPGAGHYVQLERPAETTAALREFLIGLA
jgi:pimeloyl-ACP methyl ester carboxylesterase